ncbi:hypothetical protein ACFTXM_33910 [Streptomyces sp. NPDC056930]
MTSFAAPWLLDLFHISTSALLLAAVSIDLVLDGLQELGVEGLARGH